MVDVDSLLLGRYRLGDKVATGGMGTVFSATDEKLGRTVAIKVLADNLAHDQSFVERFRREARAAAGLGHPNIASVYDYGVDDGCHFIVMELVEGRDLAQLLRAEGPLSPERTVAIVGQICTALGHAHAAGIVHRDVKPANVIVDGDDRVKVTDFGIARAAGDSKLTMTGSVLGTSHYISPEQANGAPMSQRSDLYSLGIVIYECLTGAVPFTGSSPMAVAMKHMNDDVPPPSVLNPDVPAALDWVVATATAKEPSDRYGDADEMMTALEATLAAPAGAQTAVLAAPVTDELTQGETTVWPIPGDRWDPTTLGRKVLIGFALLTAIALALLIWRVSSIETPARSAPDTGSQANPPVEPAQSASEESAGNFTLDESVIGMELKEVEKELREAEVPFVVVNVGGEELFARLDELGVPSELAEAGEIFATEPAPGDTVVVGETITLFVSDGVEEDDFDEDDEDGEGGPPDHVRGHQKDKEEGDDD